MKKMLSVLICSLLLFSAFTVSAFAETNTTAEETTEFVLEIDVNKRYTDIVEDTDGLIDDNSEDKDNGAKKTVYIAVLVAALVVSIVILAVSLKRVPKEEDIDISGQNKTQKDKEE